MNFHTVISTTVKADMQRAWPILWKKAYETKLFIPNLQKLEIHQKTDDLVLRTMVLGETVIKERIIGDQFNHTVYFHNIKGSDMKGLIYNRLYINSNNQLILEFGSNASGHNSNIAPPTQLFAKTLSKTKEVIESL